MPGGRPIGGSARAVHSGEARKLGGLAPAVGCAGGAASSLAMADGSAGGGSHSGAGGGSGIDCASGGAGGGGGSGGASASGSSGGGGGGDMGGASSIGGAAGGGGGGRWLRPPPPSIAGGGASPVSLGARAFGRVLHGCLKCGKEFDGSVHTRHLPTREASREGAAEAVWHGTSRFCTPSCSQEAIADEMAVDPAVVEIRLSPRVQRPASEPLADGALDGGGGDPAVRQMQQQHRANYLAVDRALKKAGGIAAERGASFAAVARLPPPPQGGGLQLAVAARVGVVDGERDLLGALLAATAGLLRRRRVKGCERR